MNNDEQQLDDVLKQLKTGLVLVKRKPTGKKYSRNFFLHEREEVVSYRGSRKIFGKARTCKSKRKVSFNEFFFILDDVKDIDEIRTGFQAPTFHRLVQRGILRSNDVNIRTFHRLAR